MINSVVHANGQSKSSISQHAWPIAWLCALLLLPCTLHADEIQDDRIAFVETNSAECDGLDGKLISVQNMDQDKTLDVWLERWVAGVASTDQHKYTLSPNKQSVALGCSMIVEGDQHWKVTGMDFRQH